MTKPETPPHMSNETLRTRAAALAARLRRRAADDGSREWAWRIDAARVIEDLLDQLDAAAAARTED